MKITVICRSIRQLVFYLRKEAKVEGGIILMRLGEAQNKNGEKLHKYCVHLSNKNTGVEAGSTITLDRYNPDLRYCEEKVVYIIA